MRRTLSFGLLILMAVSAFADPSKKVAKDLREDDSRPSLDVIVQFNQAPTDKHHKKVNALGGRFKRQLDSVKGGLYSLPPGQLKKLANDPDVAYISPDRPVRGALDTAAAAVGADLAFSSGFNGTGVGVAVVDSGLNAHDDLNP